MSELLHFAAHPLQEAALAIMGTVYTARLIWLFRRFKGGAERQPTTAKNAPNISRRKGYVYSWGIIGMPWEMESTRSKLLLYSQFVVFHLGVTASIVMSFIIPYFPGFMESPAVVTAFQAVIGAACLVGLMRIWRRVSSPVMRKISSPDDYFSLILLTVWFFWAVLAAPNDPGAGETALLVYFFMTAFFLIYVPFSKISHYLYYPFTRYWLGKSLGYRGVYPLKHGPRPDYSKA